MPDDSQYWRDLLQIPTTIADDIISNSKALKGINGKYIARATSQITYESQTAGPDYITLTLNDPDWTIQDSGLCDVGPDGLLQPIDFNFPKGTDVWWRLAEVNNQGGTLDQATLQLVFYHRAVVYLMQDYGTPIKAAKGTTTQAQFIKQLCDRIPNALPSSLIGPGSARSQQIQFVCPQLNVIQPLASQYANGGKTYTPRKGSAASRVLAQINNGKGIGYGAGGLTCKGTPLTNQQIDICNAALDEADKLNAPSVVMVAIIYAGMGESSLGNDAGTTYNVWEANTPGDYGPDPNWSAMAKAWLLGTGNFHAPGGIGFAKQYPNAWQIANATENNAVWIGPPYANTIPHTQDSYGHEWPGGQAQGIKEATAIVNAYGGGSDGYANYDGKSTTGTTASDRSNVGQLERGGVDNPGEDSWSCIQRLASAQNWMAYTSVHAGSGQWGNYLTYITGPRNDKQQPAAYIMRSAENAGTWDLKASTKKSSMVTKNALLQQPAYTVDNTAYQGSTTTKANSNVRKMPRVQIPTTPTQVQIQVTAEPMTLNAGEVIVFEHAGALNGRWIVTDNTRDILDPTSQNQLTLGPPTDPLPQPLATTVRPDGSTSSAMGTQASQNSGPGTVGAVIEMAKFLSSKQLPYNDGSEGYPLPTVQKYPAYDPHGYDCACGVGYLLYNAGFNIERIGGGLGIYGPRSNYWENWGVAGPGRQMTIWCNSIHIFIEFHYNGGHQGWDSGHSWSTSFPWYSDTFYDGKYVTSGESGVLFTPRHWPGQ